MSETIKKAKIVKGKTLEVKGTRGDAEFTDVHKNDVHPDMLEAFEKMGLHLAILTGYVPASKVKAIEKAPADLAENFHVRSYSIGGEDDDLGVVISGYKTLDNGKTVTLNSPFHRFDEAEETGYKFMRHLRDLLAGAEGEVRAYLFNGKKATGPQGELFNQPTNQGTNENEPELNDEDDQNPPSQNKQTLGIPQADPEAMARVAQMDNKN